MTCDADHYWEGPYMVFTELHHLRRGSCCGSRCRHCPFEPRFEKGAKVARASVAASPETLMNA
ncbi:MAG: hypothetical protein KGN80_09850 [Acidobacteriota bacterium]|nr:hypothetical protein [Acidobacteriota bacterium]